jgi:hypothetical protein
MRKIVTAVSAAALSLSMLATAVPALAVTGYDSAYAGESAFVNISAGQTQNFQVFFANTGTTTWSRGTGTQVDLAACLEDKVTCNAQDATEASWNSGWLSATRYATTTQTTTAPGSLGTFSYNITPPAGTAAGIYHFNGDLVLSATGERIHPEGYFQDANLGGVGGGAATITSLVPASGDAGGGEDIIINGTGIVCTPAFPSVSFGGTAAAVKSCGSTSVTTTTPAHAPGTVTVTLTNSGSAASNGLSFLFEDLTGPTFVSFTVSGNLLTVTFSEPVCKSTAAGTTAADWTVNNISSGVADLATNAGDFDNIPTDCDDAVATATIVLDSPVTNGAFVETTLMETVLGDGTNTNITDAAGNPASAPQARQATATPPETTAPTMVSATGAVGSSTVTITFSEAVYCPTANPVDPDDFAFSDGTSDVDPTVTAVVGCGGTQQSATDTIDLTVSFPLAVDKTFTITATPEANELQDIAGNDLASGGTVTFTTGAGDFTPPTMVDARMAFNAASSLFQDAGDSFTLTFSEEMNGATDGTIDIQDQDGTTGTITCSAVAAANQASCSWNTAVTVLTVTLTGTLGVIDAGTTPGQAIPFNITAFTGITDTATPGNPPNVQGSSDRLVDFE